MSTIMEEIQEMLAEWARQSLEFKKWMRELRASQKETDRQMKEVQRELRESWIDRIESNREFDKRMKEVQKELGWIWNSQEEVWIDLFRRNMKKILAKKWINIDDTSTRFKNRITLEDWTSVEWEYDLMWINLKDIVVVEVKNKLKDDHIEKFIKKQLPRFKLLFPQYKDYNLYWWVWSLIVWEHQEKKAEKQWLFVFTQWEDWNAMIMNDDNFKPKVF